MCVPACVHVQSQYGHRDFGFTNGESLYVKMTKLGRFEEELVKTL